MKITKNKAVKKFEFVYWFTYYNFESPSIRYRAKFPLAYWKKNYGIGYKLIIPGYSLKRIILFLQAYFSALCFPKKNSIIVIQRVQSNFIYVRLLYLLVYFQRKRTIYDLDDADYLIYEPKHLYRFVKNCYRVSVGSKQIKQDLSAYNTNIRHITSPIVDLGRFKHTKNDLFTIGWVGGFSWGHRDSMSSLFFPALKNLSFKFKLVLVGIDKVEDYVSIWEYFHEHKNIVLEIPTNISWEDEEKIQRRILKFDIGIATLSDTEYQRSKSGIKTKQYMNNGIPVISTNLPENNNVVVDGYNGFLCDSIEEFEHKISMFYNMSDSTYDTFSRNVRSSIKNFNHQKYYEDFLQLVELTQARTNTLFKSILM